MEEPVELLFRHRFVGIPPDRGIGVGIAHDELVVDGSARVLPRLDAERPRSCKLPLVAPDCEFDKFGRRVVDVQLAAGIEGKYFVGHLRLFRAGQVRRTTAAPKAARDTVLLQLKHDCL